MIKDGGAHRPSFSSLSLRGKIINERSQWDTIIPASFFAASAVCYIEPKLAPSILFALMALATIYVSPVMQYYTKPATEGLTDTIINSLNTFTDEENSEQREKLFFALAELISKSIQSTALQSTMKESLTSALMDDELQDAILNTVQNAMLKASENETFRTTALNVMKQAFTGALNDEAFVRELMSGVVNAMVQASKEEELTSSVLAVVTRGVSQALADESFVTEIRGAVKDTLQDGELYKAGARGMVSAQEGILMLLLLQKRAYGEDNRCTTHATFMRDIKKHNKVHLKNNPYKL